MKWFSNLKLATKLLAGFLTILLVTAFLGGFSVLQLNGLNHSTKQIADIWLPGVDTIGSMRSWQANERIKLFRLIATESPEARTKIEADIQVCQDKINDCRESYGATVYLEEDRRLVASLDAARKEYDTAKAAILEQTRQQNSEKSQELLIASVSHFDNLWEAYQKLVDFNREQSKLAGAAAAQTYSTGFAWIIGGIVVAVGLGLAIALCIAKIVGNPIRQMAATADQVALGDVEQVITIDTTDEVGTLAASFRKIIESQKELAHAAGQIAAGDMSVNVKSRSEKDVLSKSFQTLQKSINGLVAETDSVVQAAKNGQLSTRGQADKFQGAYRQLVQGFNDTLDAVIEPVKEASSVLERVANRDLTARVKGNYQGDHALIKNSLNSAVENLEEALSQAAVGAEQVTAAATQIANGSQALAQGASEQASSLEEVSSSLEEMASMTKQNAENSNQGKSLAGEASTAAVRGNDAMKRMADAIAKIKASSDATAKIVKTIDEIAFQTNLLALNAAVEAARAGEAGKGFAVVAEEVRNLAQRSAEAAKNTANMIEESVKNADGGVKITEEVAQVLVEIGEGSRKVNDLVAEIAAASQEQSKGIEQINLAVNQLDKVTQQNAANSEESASAAEELNSQAVTLSQTVAQFKLNTQQGQTGPAAAEKANKLPKVTKNQDNWQAALQGKERGSSNTKVAAGRAKATAVLSLDEDDFKGF